MIRRLGTEIVKMGFDALAVASEHEPFLCFESFFINFQTNRWIAWR